LSQYGNSAIFTLLEAKNNNAKAFERWRAGEVSSLWQQTFPASPSDCINQTRHMVQQCLRPVQAANTNQQDGNGWRGGLYGGMNRVRSSAGIQSQTTTISKVKPLSLSLRSTWSSYARRALSLKYPLQRRDSSNSSRVRLQQVPDRRLHLVGKYSSAAWHENCSCNEQAAFLNRQFSIWHTNIYGESSKHRSSLQG
jgi:hypothetical protein